MSAAALIYEKVAKVSSEVGAVTKSRKNLQGGGYQYRGIDDVMAALQPLMASHGIVCATRVIDRERESITTTKGNAMISVRLLVEHTFYANDGSSVVCTTLGEAFDSGDKASNKAMAVALKYALTTVFMIPTYEVDRDTEEHSHAVAPPAPRGIGTSPAHPTVEKAKQTFEGSRVVDATGDEPEQVVRAAIDFVTAKLKAIWPGDEGTDREMRLGWWYAQFMPKGSKRPDDWNPSRALLQAGPAKCSKVKEEASKLEAGSRIPGGDDAA